jgi:hypothetical protein
VAVHAGNPAVYHLDAVLKWFKDVRKIDVRDDLVELSVVTRKVNLAKELSQIPRGTVPKRLQHLVA